jgi:hypothetical protein
MAGKASQQPDSRSWDKDGYTLQTPTDPSASQGDADILRGDDRSQDPIDRMSDADDFQLGKRKMVKGETP